MKTISMLVAALVGSVLLASENSSHGGDIVVCDGLPPIVLDYYHAALKGVGETKPDIPNIKNWSQERTLLFFRNKLKNYIIRFEIEDALMKLGAFETWAEADLKEVDDSDEPYFLPKNCSRKQGAIRQGNQMFVDPTYVSQLNESQRAMLILHEAIFYVANKHGQGNSVSTRNLIRILLRNDSTENQVIDAVHALGSIIWPYEMFNRESYRGYGEYNPNEIIFDRVSAKSRTIHVRNLDYFHDPVVLSCEEDGLTCKLTQPLIGKEENSVLHWKNAIFTIHDGGRKLKFTSTEGKEKIYFRQSSKPWPFPIGE